MGKLIEQATGKYIQSQILELTDRITFEDGTHEHRPHVHSQHKVAMTMNVQIPDELLPRYLQLNFCNKCHLVWYQELPHA